jgi:hypothetical protein
MGYIFLLSLNIMAYDIENTFKQILLSIEEGNSLRATLRREDMPTSTTFYDWIDNDEEKSVQYARACEKRADTIFEEILDISDDASNDFTLADIGDGMQIERFNSEHVQRSRLRVDARKWMLGKMNPKKYGDKIMQEHSGEVKNTITPIVVEITPPLEDED